MFIILQVIVGIYLVAFLLMKTNTPVDKSIWKREVRPNYYTEQSLTPVSTDKEISKNISKSITLATISNPDLSQEKPIKILFWNQGNEGFLKKCDVPCYRTKDKSDAMLSEVSAVVFHIPSYGGNPRAVLKGRASQAVTVGLSMESAEYYRRQRDLSDYDLTCTTSFDSDLPVTYFGWNYDLLLNVSDWPWEKREPAILFVAKNCHSRNRRETLVKMLSKYIRVDSVSSCLNNHPWPADIPRSNKDVLQKRYMLYLAAENSNEKDYVTEKVYGGLINGAVPLYLGASNVQEFVPSHSVIQIPNDFTEADVVRIANIAKTIISNKTVYEEWIEFKKHPYEEKFKRKMSVANAHIWCRLCRKIYATKHGLGWDKELQKIVF